MIDLHTHTTHSDGSLAPAELIRLASEKNLTAIAVTDHDTMSGFKEASEEAARRKIEFIPGIEISVKFEPGTLHILGYFLDPENSQLQAMLFEIQKARSERNPQMVEALRGLGIEISLEEVLREAYGTSQAPEGKQLGRPHFAKVLVKKRVVKSSQEAFEKFLAKGRPAYVDKRKVTSREAVEAIHAAGGVTSVAHPVQMRLEGAALETEIGRLAGEGLDAIEVYNSCQRPEHHKIYQALAKQWNLAVTGGSDFHGAHKPGVELGNAGVKLGYDLVEGLLKRRGQRK